MRPRARVLGLLLLATLASACQGSVRPTYYMVQDGPRLQPADLTRVSDPPRIAASFEYRAQGAPDAKLAQRYRWSLQKALQDSLLFSEVVPGDAEAPVSLTLVVHDPGIGNRAWRFVRDLFSQLTLDIVGLRREEELPVEAIYRSETGASTQRTYVRRLVMTRGVFKDEVEGVTGRPSVDDAVEELVDQVVLELLRDLQAEGAL